MAEQRMKKIYGKIVHFKLSLFYLLELIYKINN